MSASNLVYDEKSSNSNPGSNRNSINLKGRSISVSSTPLLNGDLNDIRPNVLGSNFFKDGNDINVEESQNLDIVGALNNLNLDEEINNFDQHEKVGTLTPNPSNFEFNNFISTPTWNYNGNFIPQTAPPFNYEPELTDKIPKHFELPDEKDPKLNLPFSTPPPAAMNHQAFVAKDSSSESDLDNSVDSTITPHQLYRPFSVTPNSMEINNQPYANGGGSNFWSSPQIQQHVQQQVQQQVQQHVQQQVQQQVQEQVQQQVQQQLINSQMNMRGNFLNPIQHNQFNSNRFNRRSNNNNYNQSSNYVNANIGNYNDVMNVHRKLHNNPNRRKGDDASKYVNAKLEDFTGEIYSLCKDQHGCRFLQKQLDLGKDIENKSNVNNVLSSDIAATMIFNEIYLKIIELMIDPFGNYLIQKLFENVSVDQRIILVKNASPEFIRIALDPHGTRALQKLVECISTEEECKLIIENLSPHIVSLSRDLNGNHVVQKCLQKLNSKQNQFIFDTASIHCNEIATHRHGCCVLQRCLDYGNASQRRQLSIKIAENATNLSLDPFGNYVVQYVLSRGDEKLVEIILNHIKNNFIVMSLHKFGSNVIEKSLRINKLTNGLLQTLLMNSSHFPDLLNDPYGNYVLQTSLDVASKTDMLKLSHALQPLLPNVKNTPHGRRIMSKVQSILL